MTVPALQPGVPFSPLELPVLSPKKTVPRLGIAGNYGLSTKDLVYAAERGVRFWLWARSFGKATRALKEFLPRERERHVIVQLVNGFTPGLIRNQVEKALKELGTDYLDAVHLGWLGVGARLGGGVLEALLKLKQAGKTRAIGCSIHDRARAAELVQTTPLDSFMLRYNAKHPGAETDVFPALRAASSPKLVVAYTATSWGQLLRPLKGASLPPWPATTPDLARNPPPPLTAALCYRFCLSHPAVHVVLSGPKTRTQLEENLESLSQGPLNEAELTWVRAYGAWVKQRRRIDFL
jgi:aryl-alcohol dehydrogenase-like predicted oxidoreductase